LSATPPIFVVDAFTSRPFSGNPAAVCLLESPASDEWMMSVAAEMNLSETAFVVPGEDGFGLRWFTPVVESDLCGHATLASAHVLWETAAVAGGDAITFHSRSGPLTASCSGGWVELDFPAEPAAPAEIPARVLDALGLAAGDVVYAGRNRLDLLLEVVSPAMVRRLEPDFRLLGRVGVRGVMVTSLPDEPGCDFISRFFAPGAGIDEDPVTGSAHCCLGPHWGARLGRDRLTGRQVSRRGGVVRVALRGERVDLIGEAVTVWRGRFTGAPPASG
jgi:PhzF family phenazine biosynthesis protein